MTHLSTHLLYLQILQRIELKTIPVVSTLSVDYIIKSRYSVESEQWVVHLDGCVIHTLDKPQYYSR